MPVIVFNKRTGKYLKRHSGSYDRKWNWLVYRKDVKKIIEEKFGPRPPWRREGGYDEKYHKYWSKRNQFLIDTICDADPGDARVYATKASAITSVGYYNRNNTSKYVYALPDYFEIHEIKESFVCVMRPDGSSNCDDEETK